MASIRHTTKPRLFSPLPRLLMDAPRIPSEPISAARSTDALAPTNTV